MLIRIENTTINLLLVHDNTQSGSKLERELRAFGINTASIASSSNAIQKALQGIQVVLLHQKSISPQSIILVKKLREAMPEVPVIIDTGFVTVSLAVSCMKMGVNDILIRTYDTGKLVASIIESYQKTIAGPQRSFNREECKNKIVLGPRMIGESLHMRKIRKLIGLAGPSEATVLILGETGTGKELVARGIHDVSTRRESPLVVVNASTLQEDILESELFGYIRGAFTGANSDKKGLLEVAHNGTCFIDEVADMNPVIQAKLLRVIETGSFIKLGATREIKVNIRFIFATNVDLASAVQNGNFRKDLYYRVNVFPIKLPLLRERREDIELLSEYFLDKFTNKRKCLSKTAQHFLTMYGWPGNVRELANVIQHSILISGTRTTILPKDLPENIVHGARLPNRRKSRHSADLATTRGGYFPLLATIA